MADIKAETKRSFLRSLYRQTSDTATLLSVLEAFQDDKFSSLSGGKIISATSQAGHSTQYVAPTASSAFTEDQILALAEEFLALYDAVKSDLATEGNATPTDEDIFNRMIASNALASVNEEYSSYTTAFWQGR